MSRLAIAQFALLVVLIIPCRQLTAQQSGSEKLNTDARNAETKSADSYLVRHVVSGVDLQLAYDVVSELLAGAPADTRLAPDKATTSLILLARDEDHQRVRETLEKLSTEADAASKSNKTASSGASITLDGERIKVHRVYECEVWLPEFRINVAVSRIFSRVSEGAMMGMGMGGEGGYGMSGGGPAMGGMGMGPGGGMGGMPGGVEEPGMPGMGGPGAGGKSQNKQGRVLPVPIYALVLDDITAADGTTSQRPEVKLGLFEMGGYGDMGMGGLMGGGMGAMGGMGMGGGGYGGAGRPSESTYSTSRPMGMGDGGYGGAGGMGGYGAGMAGADPHFLSLSSEGGKQFLRRHKLSTKQAELLQELMTQAVLRQEAVSVIEVEKGQGERAEQAEQLLKEVLRENYASRLAQQELQIDKLKEQIAILQADIDRRRQAIDRVADLELARIVLTAQGLIDEKTP